MRFSLLQMNLHHYYVDVSTLGRQKTDPTGQHKLMPTCCLLFIPLTRISNDPGPLKYCYPLGTCLTSHLGFLEQDPSLLWKPLTKNSPFAFNSFTLRREEEEWPEATSFLFGPACLSKGNKKQQKWQRRWIPSSLHINLFFWLFYLFIYLFILFFQFILQLEMFWDFINNFPAWQRDPRDPAMSPSSHLGASGEWQISWMFSHIPEAQARNICLFLPFLQTAPRRKGGRQVRIWKANTQLALSH